jgi:hypothetical protein
MTVAELIRKLEAFEPDTRVVTPGFDESNYDDVETVEVIVVQFRDDLEVGHGGRHVRAAHGEPAILINW